MNSTAIPPGGLDKVIDMLGNLTVKMDVMTNIISPVMVDVPTNPVKAFNDHIRTREKYWRGSLSGDIYKVVTKISHKIYDYGKNRKIPHKKCFEIAHRIEMEVNAVIAYQMISGIDRYWKEVLSNKLDAPGIENYIMGFNLKIKGVISWKKGRGYLFYNFYDKNCDFPFPPGLKERLMKMAEEATEEKVAEALERYV